MFGVCFNAFIQQICIKLIKSDSIDIYDIDKYFYFQINAILLNFLFIIESWKKKFHKILSSKNFLNIDNNNNHY